MKHPHILRQMEVLLSSSDDQHHGLQMKVEDVENTKLTVNNLIIFFFNPKANSCTSQGDHAAWDEVRAFNSESQHPS